MSHKVQYLTVETNHIDQRIDNFLKSRCRGLPKSRLYKALRKGEVRVNKRRIGADYRLQLGDHIRLPPFNLPPPGEKTAVSTQLQAILTQSIIASSEDFLILNKPAHLAVHGGSGVKIGLIDALGQILKENNPYLQLAHRLDKETSGCLVIAKNLPFLRHFQSQMQQGAVKKSYHALVSGYWQKGTRTLQIPLRRVLLANNERRVCVDSIENGAKNAITRFSPVTQGANMTLLEARLITGRTHQIRVHSAHCHHPIVGDIKYGDKITNQQASRQGFKRLGLHAKTICFYLPNGQYRCYQAPTPMIFFDILKSSVR